MGRVLVLLSSCVVGAVVTVTVASAENAVSLPEACRLAASSNPTLRILEARVNAAEAIRARAWSALKPSASVSALYQRNAEEAVLDFTGIAELFGTSLPADPASQVVIQKRDQFGFDFRVDVPLFRGPAYPQLGIAKKGIAVAKLEQERGRQRFLLNVAQAYYRIVTGKEEIRALENKVRLDQRNEAATRARVEAGTAPRADLMRAELELTESTQQRRQKRFALEADKRALSILIGSSGTVDATKPPTPKVPPGALNPKRALKQALAKRADWRASGLSVKNARSAKNAIWWRFAPTLDFSALYRWQNAEGFSGKQGAWSFAFNVALPLYDGGERYALLREESARWRETEHRRRELAQRMETELVGLIAELRSAESALISAKKAVVLAKTTAQDMAARYEVDTATQLEVLDANQRLFEATLAETRSRYGRDLIRLRLLHALGRFEG